MRSFSTPAVPGSANARFPDIEAGGQGSATGFGVRRFIAAFFFSRGPTQKKESGQQWEKALERSAEQRTGPVILEVLSSVLPNALSVTAGRPMGKGDIKRSVAPFSVFFCP
jgi:hypothetical protein